MIFKHCDSLLWKFNSPPVICWQKAIEKDFEGSFFLIKSSVWPETRWKTSKKIKIAFLRCSRCCRCFYSMLLMKVIKGKKVLVSCPVQAESNKVYNFLPVKIWTFLPKKWCFHVLVGTVPYYTVFENNS